MSYGLPGWEKDEPEEEEAPVEYHLPFTRLMFSEGTLTKRNGDRTIVATFSGESLAELRTVRALSWTSAGMSLGFAWLTWLFYTHVETETGRWISTLICAVLTLVSLSSLRETRLVIQTADDTVEYSVSESDAEAKGFAISVNQHLRLEEFQRSVCS